MGFCTLFRLNVFARSLPERESASSLLDQLRAAEFRFAQQRRQHVHAVRTVTRHQGLSRERSERGEEIDLANQRVGYTGLNPGRPAGHKRNTSAALENAVLPPAQGSSRAMAVQFLERLILITVIHHRTIIA